MGGADTVCEIGPGRMDDGAPAAHGARTSDGWTRAPLVCHTGTVRKKGTTIRERLSRSRTVVQSLLSDQSL
jgi:hypothetical protein